MLPCEGEQVLLWTQNLEAADEWSIGPWDNARNGRGNSTFAKN